jgi:hypothetical protein
MKTINIAISEGEINKYGLKSSTYDFSTLVDIVSRELSRQKLIESIELAEKYGLSSMTMNDITKEVRATRKHAKARS